MTICKEIVCNKQAFFNYQGEKPIYCKNHRKPDMINVVSKRCIIKGCTIQSNYNFECETTGLYCNDHKNLIC
jgi:hypothetical protein